MYAANDYDKVFTVTVGGRKHTFERYPRARAGVCALWLQVMGHGVEHDGTVFCCASCAKHEGLAGLKDRA